MLGRSVSPVMDNGAGDCAAQRARFAVSRTNEATPIGAIRITQVPGVVRECACKILFASCSSLFFFRSHGRSKQLNLPLAVERISAHLLPTCPGPVHVRGSGVHRASPYMEGCRRVDWCRGCTPSCSRCWDLSSEPGVVAPAWGAD